jgi:hypothetical protein
MHPFLRTQTYTQTHTQTYIFSFTSIYPVLINCTWQWVICRSSFHISFTLLFCYQETHYMIAWISLKLLAKYWIRNSPVEHVLIRLTVTYISCSCWDSSVVLKLSQVSRFIYHAPAHYYRHTSVYKYMYNDIRKHKCSQHLNICSNSVHYM